MTAGTIVERMDDAITEYRQLKAELTRRPTASEIEVKLTVIELILAEYGLEWKYIGADGPDPGEYVGYRVEIHPVSGWIDIGTEHGVDGCFPFHTSYTEIRAWARAKEAELLASIPY